MLALIKREIQDHLVYFAAAAALSVILTIVLVKAVINYDPKDPPLVTVSLGAVISIIVALGITGMGASQMYWDRTRRISAFISTQPVTRSRILLARIIAGALAILILLVPVVIAASVLLRIFTLPVPPIYDGLVPELFAAAFLLALASYCIGLQTGWNPSALAPSLGGLGLTCIFVLLVVVKGPGPEVVVILVLFIAASLYRTWHSFSSTSL
jgi:hypothetical protein